MNKFFKAACLFAVLILSQISYGQTNKEQALAKAREAVKLEDEEGKYDEAIKLFEEARDLDPENINYGYEIAYAYSGKKEYRKASEILEKLLKHKDVSGRVYQALGNAYDYQGKADKAIDTYEKGISKFPNAGELYLEMGNMKISKKEYDKALGYYEKGIEMDPQFPSNYYWATKLFLGTEEEVWGMLYGEIFINLERNSKRTAEISKLLFDTYKSEIKFTSDTSYSISFSQNASININDLKDAKNFKLPFGIGCYEPLLLLSVGAVRMIDLPSLNGIRTRFLENYFSRDHSKKYPNVLFDYQQKMKIAKQLEAYNHWLLMQGDKEGFQKWINENEEKWEKFKTWFSENKLELDQSHRFHRKQY